MTRTVFKSRVGSDGVLSVRIPLGPGDADRDVLLTVEPVAGNGEQPSDYVSWLESIAGRWQGEFERFPQGEFEQRDPL
jgi:hypothetical protein